MKPIHNKMFCRKHTVEKKNTSGLVLPNQKETEYEVVQAGPKVTGIKVGDRVKPFKYSAPMAEITDNDEKLFVFNQEQIQDII